MKRMLMMVPIAALALAGFVTPAGADHTPSPLVQWDQANDDFSTGWPTHGGMEAEQFVPTLPALDTVELCMASASTNDSSARVIIRKGESMGGSTFVAQSEVVTLSPGNPFTGIYTTTRFNFSSAVELAPGETYLLYRQTVAGGPAVKKTENGRHWFRQGLSVGPGEVDPTVAESYVGAPTCLPT